MVKSGWDLSVVDDPLYSVTSTLHSRNSKNIRIIKEGCVMVHFKDVKESVELSSLSHPSSVLLLPAFIEIEHPILKNLPARVTMEGIIIPETTKISHKLQMLGAAFVDYSATSKQLIFDVPHFSKYDLSMLRASDSEEEDEDDEEQIHSNSYSGTPITSKISSQRRSIGFAQGSDESGGESDESANFSISGAPSPSHASPLANQSSYESDDDLPPNTGMNALYSDEYTETETQDEEEYSDEDGEEEDYYPPVVGYVMPPGMYPPVNSLASPSGTMESPSHLTYTPQGIIQGQEMYPPIGSVPYGEQNQLKSDSRSPYTRSPSQGYHTPSHDELYPQMPPNSAAERNLYGRSPNYRQSPFATANDIDGSQITSSEEESESESQENVIDPLHPDLDIGKAQVMKNVFFPFPHTSDNQGQNLRVSQGSSMLENSPGKMKTPKRLSLSLSTAPLSSTPDKIFKSPFSTFQSPTQRSGNAIVEETEENLLFPEQLPFPPKKKFQFGAQMDSSSLTTYHGFQAENAVIELDDAASRRVPLQDSLTRPIITPNNNNNHSDVSDFGLSMGRSFRAGFGPAGLFAVQSPSESIGIVSITSIAQSTCGMSLEVAKDQYEQLLSIHSKRNEFTANEYQFTPSDEVKSEHVKKEISRASLETIGELMKTLSSRLASWDELDTSTSKQNNNEWKGYTKYFHHALTLIHALWGTSAAYNTQDNENEDSNLHLIASEPILYDREENHILLACRYACSAWGQEILSGHIRSDDFTFGDQLIHLLTARKLREAVDHCIDEKEFRLATIIARACDIDMRTQMNQQCDEWKFLLDHDISSGLSRLYRLLGGQISSQLLIEDADTLSPISDWLQCFFLFFWYGTCSNEGPYVLGALNSFRNSDLFSRFPPCYGASGDHGVADILYQLLTYFTEGLPACAIWDVLDPLAYNSNAMEYSTGWFVFTLLSALLQDKYHTEDSLSEEQKEMFERKLYQLTVSFATQLEMMGLIQWSVYVLSHLPDENLRISAVRSILDRNAFLLPDHVQCFLRDQIHVPDEFIYEALAYGASYQHQEMDCFDFLLRAGQKDKAHAFFIEYIGPRSILQFHVESQSFLTKEFEVVPELLLQLANLMENKEGAYRIYLNYFITMIPSFFVNQQADSFPEIIQLVRSRLSELSKYSAEPERLRLERLVISDVPSHIAAQIMSLRCHNDDLALMEDDDLLPAITNLALGSHHQPMPSSSQFSFFDNVSNALLYPA